MFTFDILLPILNIRSGKISIKMVITITIGFLLIIVFLFPFKLYSNELNDNNYGNNRKSNTNIDISESIYYFSMGISSYNDKKYQDALNYFELTISIDPMNTKAFTNIGHIYRVLNDIDKSLNSFLNAYNLSPNEPNCNYNLAVTYHSLNDISNAIKFYHQTISLDSKHVNSHYNLGLLYQDIEEFQLALQHYMNTLRINPYHIDSRLNYCNILFTVYFNDNNIDDYMIEKCYQDVISIDNYYVRGIINMGSYYHSISNSTASNIDNIPLLLIQKPNQLSDNTLELYLNDLIYNCKKYNMVLLAFSYYYLAYLLESKNVIAAHAINSLSTHPIISNLSINLLDSISSSNNISSQYIIELFDSYAYHFENSLINNLNYTSHIHITTIISDHINIQSYDLADVINVLDLGAGTGLLCNPLVSMLQNKYDSFNVNITGIDLSHKMLEKAKLKNCYNLTLVTDINEYLTSIEETYLLIVAADVFVYIGDLYAVLTNIYTKLLPNGFLGFTVELLENRSSTCGDYELLHTGRYAHCFQYISNIVTQCNYKIIEIKSSVLRQNQGESVHGLIVLLQK